MTDVNESLLTDENERRETYRRIEDIYRKAIEDIRDYAIFLTDAGNADRRRALLAGFQTHLPKPVEPDDLLAAIQSLTFQPPANQR